MIDVVIIDDEVWVAKMITQIIDWGAYGFRIAGIFHDGEEGLDGIRRLHPRLVLTDIRMPGLTGLDLIQTLSEESPDIMFVIISGYNDFEYAKSALTYGAIGYLLKPIDETELKKVVLKAKKQLVSEELKQRSELQIRDTMGHTVEKLREQFFINFILGLGDRSIALNRVNEDLKLNFRTGSFQVVNLLLEQKNCSKICIDLITKAIWEEIRDTMGHTVEKLREQFFINFILGLGDRSIALNRVNEDLKLNFRTGSFQVVNLLLEQKNCSKICIDLITKAIWEVDLPTECCEMVTLNPRGDSILILNYTPEQKNAIQQILDRFFAVLLEKRPPCGITMGVGSVSGNFSDICVSYQSAHEIAMYRLLRGTNRVYSALKLPHTVSENTHTLDLNHDISLKQAFQSGDLEAVQKLTAQWIQWYFTKAQQAPQILIGGLNHLLSLYQENAPSGTRDWKAYFLERRDEIGAASSLQEVNLLLANAAKTILDSREPDSAASGQTAVQEVLRYIDHHYMQDLSLSEVADMVRLNPNYFCEIFKREAGVNFKEYLVTKRIEQAKQLLKSPSYKLNEVAEMVGYRDGKHFGKAFKKLVGITPGAYRKLMLGHE